jgi:hypothetical protein
VGFFVVVLFLGMFGSNLVVAFTRYLSILRSLLSSTVTSLLSGLCLQSSVYDIHAVSFGITLCSSDLSEISLYVLNRGYGE